MDEMLISLGSKLMRKILTKLLSKYIKNQFGYDVDISLDELHAHYCDGDVKIKTNVEIKMDRKEMKRILTKIEENI